MRPTINGIVFSILNLHEHKYCSSEAGVSKEKTTMKYTYFPAGNYMLKVNNTNTRAKCEICSKLTIKTPERRQWRRSGVFIRNFEHISHLVLVFVLLTLSR